MNFSKSILIIMIIVTGLFISLFNVSKTASFSKNSDTYCFSFDNEDQNSILDLKNSGWSFTEAKSDYWAIESMEISKSSPNILRAHGNGPDEIEGVLFTGIGANSNCSVEGWVYQKNSNSMQTGLIARCSTNENESLEGNSFYEYRIYSDVTCGIHLIRINNGVPTGLASYDLGCWTANTWYYLKLVILTQSNGSVFLRGWCSENDPESLDEPVLEVMDNSTGAIYEGYPGVIARCNKGVGYYSLFDNLKIHSISMDSWYPLVIIIDIAGFSFPTLFVSVISLSLLVRKRRKT
ncbi:MAG: hypothetical protein ACTSP4_10845 [Candidatus Hodarchaeales archaeon]